MLHDYVSIKILPSQTPKLGSIQGGPYGFIGFAL